MSEPRRLQYNYARIDLETGKCTACMTFSYEANHPEWFAIPKASSDYVGKYYFDGLWYEDAERTIPWTPPT